MIQWREGWMVVGLEGTEEKKIADEVRSAELLSRQCQCQCLQVPPSAYCPCL